jgi:hypothetical protein
MSHENVHQKKLAESYVAGRLTEAARDEFEEHYFGCDVCFEEVAALRAVKEALPLARPARRMRVWVWALPIAAALLLALVLWRRPAPQREVAVVRPPAQGEAALAQFDPPVWNPVQYRGQDSEAHAAFVSAMSRYQARDYAGCGQALSGIDLTEARFYEGICWLLSGHDAAGSSALRQTIGAGDTAYLEEARYYLAKSLIGRGNVARARSELEQVVAMHGDLEHQASELLAKLR